MTGNSRLTAGEAGRQPWPCRRKGPHGSHGACPGIDFPNDFVMRPPARLVEAIDEPEPTQPANTAGDWIAHELVRVGEVRGLAAAGHMEGGFWHPGARDGCPKCPGDD